MKKVLAIIFVLTFVQFLSYSQQINSTSLIVERNYLFQQYSNAKNSDDPYERPTPKGLARRANIILEKDNILGYVLGHCRIPNSWLLFSIV